MEVPGAETGASPILVRNAHARAAAHQERKARSFAAWLRSRLVSDSEGGTLVEMAVCLPIVMLIMTGTFSYSLALYQKLQLAEAVSAGGRLLSVDRGDTDPCKTATSAIAAAGAGLSSTSINLTYKLNGTSQGANTKSCPGPGSPATANTYMVAGSTAEIDATYPCSLTVYGSAISSCTLQTNIVEVVQ
jgi:Flp pilus assembly protein TadG